MKIPQQHIGDNNQDKHQAMKIHLPEVCVFKFNAPYSREAILIIDHLKAMKASDRIVKHNTKKAA